MSAVLKPRRELPEEDGSPEAFPPAPLSAICCPNCAKLHLRLAHALQYIESLQPLLDCLDVLTSEPAQPQRRYKEPFA